MGKKSNIFSAFWLSLTVEGVRVTLLKTVRFFYKICLRYCVKLPKKITPSSLSLIKQLSRNPAAARKKALALIGDIFTELHSSRGQYEVVAGRGLEFSRRQVVLVAHWDPDGIVDPYVKHLCRHFKKLGKMVVLCSANTLHESVFSPEWADAIVCRKCPGYDFTSWKVAVEAFPSLYSAEELTFCNDSVFAPIGSYAPVYDAMASVECDFWGMTASRQEMPHLQSFHLVFRKKALSHSAVRQFFSAVVCRSDRSAAIDFELRLGLWLELHGLQPAAFIPFFGAKRNLNPSLLLWKQLLDWGCPIFKREQLSKGGKLARLYDWWATLQENGYPVEYIAAYYYRLGIDISPASYVGRRANACPPNIMLQQQAVVLPEGEPSATSLAVIIHCYYIEILPELASYLKNLPTWANLFVSTDSEEKAAAIRENLNSLEVAHIEVRVLPNVGWDIAPFLVGFEDVILQHELILKVHAKASSHMEQDFSAAWRELLYSALMGDAKHIAGILKLFGTDPGLGMLAPPTFLSIREIAQSGRKNLKKILRHLNFDLRHDDAIDFPVGSMFWARSSALRPLVDMKLTFDDFEYTDAKVRDYTLAHAVERAFFFSCHRAGFAWGRVPPAPYRVLRPVENNHQ
nr:rhamnan synthesis F family protein [uncultured Desulfovibrio sp.]